eukprot:1196421-Prorocentrum_minimum.AAC.4
MQRSRQGLVEDVCAIVLGVHVKQLDGPLSNPVRLQLAGVPEGRNVISLDCDAAMVKIASARVETAQKVLTIQRLMKQRSKNERSKLAPGDVSGTLCGPRFRRLPLEQTNPGVGPKKQPNILRLVVYRLRLPTTSCFRLGFRVTGGAKGVRKGILYGAEHPHNNIHTSACSRTSDGV